MIFSKGLSHDEGLSPSCSKLLALPSRRETKARGEKTTKKEFSFEFAFRSLMLVLMSMLVSHASVEFSVLFCV